MSHIATSQPTIKPREKATFLTRVLDQCIRLLPFVRLSGFFPMPPWGLVDPRPEQAREETPPAHAEKPRTE